MVRNREVRRFVLLCLGLTGLFVLLGRLLSGWTAAWLGLAAGLTLTAAFCLFTGLRYRQLCRLSRYLNRLAAGGEALDIRDNREGELSILKNDIYKVSLTLRSQAQLLQRDKTALADALSDISHQLKTPLTGMMVITDLLAQEQLEPEQRRAFTQKLSGQLKRMEWLVSSLLKLSKIDAGQIHFKEEQVGVEELVQKALEPMAIPMELKEQTAVVEGEADLSVCCDRNWTAEALVNILKNAMEHTPAGGQIRILWQRNPLHTALVLSDTGPGICREDLPHLFERFYRGKNAGPDSVGIGLAMAKGICSRQNIELEAVNGPTGGASFVLRFYSPSLKPLKGGSRERA